MGAKCMSTQQVMQPWILAGMSLSIMVAPCSAFAHLPTIRRVLPFWPALPHLCNAGSCRKFRPMAGSFKMAAAVPVGPQAAGSAHAILCAAAGKAQAIESGTQLLVSKILGYGILVGSLFLQVPQLYKILKLKSVAGISRWSRYSEVPINTSSCIYHFLIGAPLSTWGENIIVLTQNIFIVSLCWSLPRPLSHRLFPFAKYNKHTCKHTHAHQNAQTYTHTHKHTNTKTQTHTHTHTHTQIHMHAGRERDGKGERLRDRKSVV